MKYTKEKWIVNDSDLYLNQEFKIISTSTELEYEVAKVPNYKFVNSEVNAKLISKAPEMYEALNKIVGIVYKGKLSTDLMNALSEGELLLNEIESNN